MTDEIDVGTLATVDVTDPGVHKRLIAGLRSLANRGKVPEVCGKYRGSQSPNTGYHDFDVYLVVEVDDTDPEDLATVPRLGSRSVSGTVSWPVHVTNTGGTDIWGSYDPVRFDLTVYSSSQPGEATHFVGELPLAHWQPGTVAEVAVELCRQFITRVILQTLVWGFIDVGAV